MLTSGSHSSGDNPVSMSLDGLQLMALTGINSI
jgi:hypothetical protein